MITTISAFFVSAILTLALVHAAKRTRPVLRRLWRLATCEHEEHACQVLVGPTGALHFHLCKTCGLVTHVQQVPMRELLGDAVVSEMTPDDLAEVIRESEEKERFH